MNNSEAAAVKLLKLLPFIHSRFLKPMEQITREKLSGAQFHSLNMLHMKGSMTMTELAGCMKISKQQLTPVVDRLIALGYVTRQSDPEDRRIVRIEITEKGGTDLDLIKKQTRESMGRKLSVLSENEQEELVLILDRLRQLLENVSEE